MACFSVCPCEFCFPSFFISLLDCGDVVYMHVCHVSHTGYAMDTLLELDGVSFPVLPHIQPYSYLQDSSLQKYIFQKHKGSYCHRSQDFFPTNSSLKSQ